MRMTIVPVIFGTLGSIHKSLAKRVAELEIWGRIKIIQITLLNTARIIMRVPEYFHGLTALQDCLDVAFHTHQFCQCWSDYLPSNCAHIHYLFSVKIQQASMNIKGCNFFYIKAFNFTPLLHINFHVRWHFFLNFMVNTLLVICRKIKTLLQLLMS